MAQKSEDSEVPAKEPYMRAMIGLTSSMVEKATTLKLKLEDHYERLIDENVLREERFEDVLERENPACREAKTEICVISPSFSSGFAYANNQFTGGISWRRRLPTENGHIPD